MFTVAGSATNPREGTSQDPTTISNRAAFQALPVVPSLLAYIEKIGVGIRSKPSLSRKRRVGINNRRNNKRHGSSYEDTLNQAEEMEFFTNKERDHSVRWRDQRSRDTTNDVSGKNRKGSSSMSNQPKKGEKEEKTAPDKPVGSYWLPPPPFSSFTKSDSSGNEIDGVQTQQHGRKIIRRPVKCLGKAGSLRDKLPLESIGLSEVAICGRSNVGKSTLLNALLYGNTDEGLSPRKFQRGRTPQGAMLPKGVKAITSHKPGETKELSFYQLTTDVIMQTAHETSIEEDSGSDGKKNKELVSKMSLLLVDLQGYGFAYANEERTKEWQDLMHHYLLERRSLKRILLLLDARHGFKQTDFEFLSNLQDGLVQKNVEGKIKKRELPPIQIVLTKCDLVKQADLARRALLVRRQLSEFLIREPSSLPVMLVSALPGLGFNNIRNGQPLGGVLELQRELAALVPVPRVHTSAK
ncbi:hypothetical protein HJC23_007127 [Cyclotella cryptica]|uniref:EngB-type G domain-containing protein n=1 Tax=Cyclotella cryptica TaxID=29204 RepID=A0ABD3NMX6_9STRA